jgi:hypothetical protein
MGSEQSYPLQSTWLRRNQRLQQCLVSDPAHVKIGDKGEHAALIQGALSMLDGADISRDEQARQFYGQGTASAVLKYKKKRKIINYSYQTSPDDIVGRMTIRSLDTEMLAYERGKFGFLLAFGVPSPPRGMIIHQTKSLPQAAQWARQLTEANGFLGRVESLAGNHRDIVKSIQDAIQKAGPGGLLIFAVGHGIFDAQFSNAGAFDIAADRRMRIGGKNSFADPKCFVDVFYDTPRPPPSPYSDKEIDEQLHPGGWQLRLERWGIYQDLCKAFVDGKLGLVVLMTCKVGNSTDFLKKVASQWQTPILAYREYTTYDGFYPHARAVLWNDTTPGKGTNVPFSEICIPISMPDMVVVSPPAKTSEKRIFHSKLPKATLKTGI